MAYKVAGTREGTRGIIRGERIVLQANKDGLHTVETVLHVLEVETLPLHEFIAAQAQEIERLKAENAALKAMYLAAYTSHQVLGHIAINLANAKSILFEHNGGAILQTPLSPQGIVDIYEKVKGEIAALQLQRIEKQESAE